MLVGQWLVLIGIVLILWTVKRPVWLGGPERRYTSEETTHAAVARAQKRTIGLWLIIGGAFAALLGF